ncbi:hypothetical protein OG562_20225 [Streptomyces sp. NBC_01275]|uniref:hypothetical protein n=1 Tax=Streptomyces sp. NBC_01275 TaxID=2903807 RepID=UPI002250C855|nr:hypothetical protein [Streptomyces sp. NBC_01275]MCX4763253.1 hypothetical protein [Streptomyces sp. NBC_01275]
MKRSEYEAAAVEFRARLNAEAAKPSGEQTWPELDDWLSVPGTVTCTTPNCAVFAEPCSVTLHENGDGIYRAQCGGCGTSLDPVLTLEDD